MRIDPQPIAPGRAERPGAARPLTLRDPAGTAIDVLIKALSSKGALLHSAGSLPTGSLVTLGIPGIGIQLARITRAEPGTLQIEFVPPIDPAKVVRAQTAETLTSVAIPQIMITQPRPGQGTTPAVAHPALPEPGQPSAGRAQEVLIASGFTAAVENRARVIDTEIAASSRARQGRLPGQPLALLTADASPPALSGLGFLLSAVAGLGLLYLLLN